MTGLQTTLERRGSLNMVVILDEFRAGQYSTVFPKFAGLNLKIGRLHATE